jgi:hypothetical protein
LKGQRIIELRKLCGKHRTVPTSYKLEGVEKGGERAGEEGDDVEKEGKVAQHNSKVTEIWKGRYKGEVVALKVIRVPQDDPYIQRTKSVSGSCDLRRVACRHSDR